MLKLSNWLLNGSLATEWQLPNKVRCISVQSTNFTEQIAHKRACKEIEIPVPWGHIAGQLWGENEQRPVLCLHGWQDNSGTFDRLAPLLPKNMNLLCIDLPGHGLSSQLPHGIPYDIFNSVAILRRIQRHYEWPCVSFLGHSLGSMLSFLYASIFPKDTEFVVGIDALTPTGLDNNRLTNEYGKSIDGFLRYDALNSSGSEPPSHTSEEVVDKFVKSIVLNAVPREHAHHLLKRGVRRSASDGNRWCFSRDVRVKNDVFPKLLHTDVVELTKNVVCPIMNVKVNGVTYFEKKEKYFEKVKILERNCKEFRRLEVDGTHHVHLVAPENIALDVGEFMLKHYGSHK